MNVKRTIASLLVLTIIVNLCPFSTAEMIETSPQKHTVTWTMDGDSYTLEPITGSRTAMVDEGTRLINAEGEAETEIQTTYYRDRTLASVSMNGTVFSFAPIMLDEYYPREIAEETEPNEESQEEDLTEEADGNELQPEVLDPEKENADAGDADISEATEEETPAEQEAEDVLDVNSQTELMAAPENGSEDDKDSAENGIDESAENDENEDAEPDNDLTDKEPEEYPAEAQTTEPEPVALLDAPQSEAAEDPVTDTQANGTDAENTPDAEQTTVQESEATPEPQQLTVGYAKTIRKTTLYKEKYGQDELGVLKSASFVYVVSCQEGQRARIVFDTPEGIVEGYVKATHVENLTESEEEHVRREASKVSDVRKYRGNPLYRVLNYEPLEKEQPENFLLQRRLNRKSLMNQQSHRQDRTQ